MPDMPPMPDTGRWFQEMQRVMGPGNVGYPLPTEPPPEYSRAMQRPMMGQPAAPRAALPTAPGGPGAGTAGMGGLLAQLALLMGGSSSPDVQRFYEQRDQQRLPTGPQQGPALPTGPPGGAPPQGGAGQVSPEMLMQLLMTLLQGPPPGGQPGMMAPPRP